MEHIVNTLPHTCVYTQEIFQDDDQEEEEDEEVVRDLTGGGALAAVQPPAASRPMIQFIVLSLSCQRQDKNTCFCTQAIYTPEVSMPASAVRRKLLTLPPALIMCLKVPSSFSFRWSRRSCDFWGKKNLRWGLVSLIFARIVVD